MIISLCGNNSIKNIVIDEMQKEYNDNLVICNYFEISFHTVIENERLKYDLMEKCSNLDNARESFRNYVEKVVSDKINNIIENSKDKIILLVTDNILTPDINQTEFFNKSDLKILVRGSVECYIDSKYDKNFFDYVINENEEINIKKLVRLCQKFYIQEVLIL